MAKLKQKYRMLHSHLLQKITNLLYYRMGNVLQWGLDLFCGWAEAHYTWTSALQILDQQESET